MRTLLLFMAVGCGRFGFQESGVAGPDDVDGSVGDSAGSVAPNLIFISPKQPDANFGGLAGADAICTDAAAAAGLGGTYRAWLSTPTVNAASRFSTARGWVRVDGAPVADSMDSLTMQHQLFHPVALDATGNRVDVFVATGTDQNGKWSQLNGDGSCSGWTTAAVSASFKQLVGLARFGTVGWTNAAGGDCNMPTSLYCLGIDRVSTLTITPASGRKAFVSKANFDAATGIAGADTLCRGEATAAGLANAGTFKALLATTAASAASRFNEGGPPWVRVDGVEVAPTATALFDQQITAPIDVRADGTYNDQQFGVAYTGALRPRDVGTNGTTCNNWSKNDATGNGNFTDIFESNFFSGYSAACDRWPGSSHIYCLEP